MPWNNPITAQWYDEREKQHKRCIRNHDENNALFRHIRATGHEIARDLLHLKGEHNAGK